MPLDKYKDNELVRCLIEKGYSIICEGHTYKGNWIKSSKIDELFLSKFFPLIFKLNPSSNLERVENALFLKNRKDGTFAVYESRYYMQDNQIIEKKGVILGISKEDYILENNIKINHLEENLVNVP